MSLGDAPRGFRQVRCTGCGLNAASCVCALFTPLPCPITISVVMPRSEARSASNSARLLSLWLPEVALHVRGGAVSTSELGPGLDRPDTALLFPGSGKARPLPAGIKHLLVPDGTWAQARRIERRFFAARGLPRVELTGPWPSVYELRRGREGLCTFEATAIALGLLQGVPLGESLLARFAEWARRARRLKAGGAPVTPADAAHGPLPEHPASAILRRLPPGTADASG